jgi:Icc-related predicted phosphoesterase
MTRKPGETRILFATDIHGSESTFRKFVNGAKFYEADVLVLGGDITGKMIIPIVKQADGSCTALFAGKQHRAKTPDEVRALELTIRKTGAYAAYVDQSGYEALQSDPKKQDELFRSLMKETLIDWVNLIEERLKDTDVVCYVTGGNDDHQEAIDLIKDSDHVRNPEQKAVFVDEIHEMVSLGWSNSTPWKTPRECSEQELTTRIESIVPQIKDMKNAIFNFHCPPVDSQLDSCVQLDDSVYPPKPIMVGGQPVIFGAGSKSVREAITKYQPLLGLHGHIHESRATTKIGRTLCLNPGSDYGETILRAAIVNLGDGRVKSQFVSG